MMSGLRISVTALALALVASVTAVAAQDSNVMFATDSIEHWLQEEPLEIVTAQGTRREDDRTQRVTVVFPSGTGFLVKWAKAPFGGEEFNNVPRYELAAYRLQKLFLEPSHYVVPPTVIRAFDLEWYRSFEDTAISTLSEINSVLVVLQYWLWEVTFQDWWDEDRFEADPLYAYHLSNMNLLTFLIRHRDSNIGNFLVSQDPENPRVFSVDNGVSLSSARSEQGSRWSRIRVDRLPAETVERLRQLTLDDLVSELGVMEEFQIRDSGLVRVSPTENLDPRAGIRREGNLVQLGLTASEIESIYGRLEDLLNDVDDGDYELFSIQ